MEDKCRILFDTDMDSDCDDAGALVMLLHAHNQGRIHLSAVIADAPSRYAAPFCEQLCLKYGVLLPIGAVREAQYAEDPRFADYRVHCAGMAQSMFYNSKINGGKRDTDYPDAVEVYRKALTESPDGSVTVVCVGFLTAIAELLKTDAGVELVRRKVRRVVSMGDAPKNGEGEMNFNYRMDAAAAQVFFERCPVPVTVCSIGTEIITGGTLSARLEKGHPLRVAYESFTGKEHCGRSSWDLVTVYRALYPEDRRLTGKSYGAVCCDAQALRAYWVRDEYRTDELLELNTSFEEMAETLEKMLYE